TTSARAAMQVLDFQNLVHKGLLEKVTRHHPFHPDLASSIKTLSVYEKDQRGIRIEMDEHRNVYLTIHPILRPGKRDAYILYHEFGHIADRLDPDFGYQQQERLALSPVQEECFLQLWNVYIDTRLKQQDLFCLPAGGEVEISVDGIRYKLPKSEVSTYLLETAAHLSQRGVPRAGSLVQAIWEHPERRLTFQDLLDPIMR
ncbi:MAG: hypothetical protein ACLFM3_09540, partial [Desulfohalobiaceae bacterium]